METQGAIHVVLNVGNRLEKNDSVSGDEAYTYNSANMLLTRGSNNYSNDPDGNALTGGGRTSAWDSQNRLVTCSYNSNASSYVYGADGLRHQSTVNGTVTDFALDGQFFVREMRGGTPYATYLTGPTGPLYRRDATGATLRWYVYDGLGSVLGEVDANGSLDATRTYDVYGLARTVSGTPTSKHGWVGALGHTAEDETGLVYMRARYYDPTTGRFLSEDPARSGANCLIYAADNPVSAFDPNGRSLKQVAFVALSVYLILTMFGATPPMFLAVFLQAIELAACGAEAAAALFGAANEFSAKPGDPALQVQIVDAMAAVGCLVGAAGTIGAIVALHTLAIMAVLDEDGQIDLDKM